MARPANWLIFLMAATITSVFIINLCAVIYDCGCRSLWAGATDHCNIHIRGVKHCPWCKISGLAFALVMLGIIVPQFVLSFHPARWPWRRRLAVALAAFPVLGILIGLFVGWLTGYWE